MMDGILIGAGDNKYLAGAGILTLVAYLPALWAIVVYFDNVAGGSGAAATALTPHQQSTALVWVWIAFAGVFMAARALTTGLRARGTADAFRK